MDIFVQKLPMVLDEVHSLIEDRRRQFMIPAILGTRGADASVPSRTVREYFYLLSDTLIGEILEPWKGGKKRKPASAGKFYFFDVGVRNALAGIREITPGMEGYGKALEHFIYCELRA